ncbi:MAG: hypothetical protein RL596_682 [Bacteroidota bacterium]|jgi:hypothetical protein
MNKWIKSVSIVVLIGLASFLTSCANIVPPAGGARDSLPPVLIAALPKDSAVNISPKQVTLTFSEFVTLQNPQDNIIISPTIKSTPRYDYKLRNVTVVFKDTLDANTTYTILFGDAIKDVNEGNIAKNFRYTFSTGKTIDNYGYSGKVILAEKGKIDSSLIVLLHKNLNDTAIIKEKARYYTKLNGKGEFQFYNLALGQYRVYVLPNDFTKKYDDSTKLFAFKSQLLTVNTTAITDTLYAFEAVKREEKKNTSVVKDDKKIKYTTSLETGVQDLLSPFEVIFSRKLKKIDTTSIILKDTLYKRVSGYSIDIDSVTHHIRIKYPWKENGFFRLIIDKQAVVDTGGLSLVKTDTIRFSTRKESDYGSIRLRFTNLKLNQNPVLQFLQSDKIVESFPITSNELFRRLFRGGTYEMRILYDANKNGVWDTGNFKTKKQPEIVQLITKPLAVKSNWDNEVIIQL